MDGDDLLRDSVPLRPVRMSRLPGTISVIRPAVTVGVVMVVYVVVAATVSGLVWLGH